MDRRVRGYVLWLNPQLPAVTIQLDDGKAVQALDAEMMGAVLKYSPAVLPALMCAGFLHVHLLGLGAVAHGVLSAACRANQL